MKRTLLTVAAAIFLIGFTTTSCSNDDEMDELKQALQEQIDELKNKQDSLANSMNQLDPNFVSDALGNDTIDEPAQYKDGNMAGIEKHLKDKLVYPEEDLRNGIQGNVFTNIYVNKEGRVADCQIIRGLSATANAEAKRLCMTLGEFVPGKHQGKTVSTIITLSVQFKIANVDPDYIGDAIGNDTIDEPASYKNGGTAGIMKHFGANLVYPEEDLRNGVEGTVITKVYVNRQGKVVKCDIQKSLSATIDAEAQRLCMTLGEFIPGKHHGETVPTIITIPIRFRINTNDPNYVGDAIGNDTIDEPAAYKDGGTAGIMKHIGANLVYPEEDLRNGVEGTVITKVYVNKQGKVVKCDIQKSLSATIDAEAKRLCMSLGEFIPGKHHGETVSTIITLPIRFRIDPNDPNYVGDAIDNGQAFEPAIYKNGGNAGMAADIQNNLVYPEEEKVNEVQGKTYVKIYVNKQGKIVKTEIARSLGAAFDAEAIRVCNGLGDFTPAKDAEGNPISVSITTTIEFLL